MRDTRTGTINSAGAEANRKTREESLSNGREEKDNDDEELEETNNSETH